MSQREEVFASHCQTDAFEVELVHDALRQLIGQVDVLHYEVRSVGQPARRSGVQTEGVSVGKLEAVAKTLPTMAAPAPKPAAETVAAPAVEAKPGK